MKKSISQKIKDFFFSRKCAVCGRIVEAEGRYICEPCLSIFRKKAELRQNGNYYYLFYYESDIKHAIAEMKLENRRHLAVELAELCKEPLFRLIREKNIHLLIPVPVSKKRFRERGFNQVEELLRELGLPWRSIEKLRDTKHMYELLDEEDRRKNIQDAFSSDLSTDGKNILLVDDIVTTGQTTNEIIKELRKNHRPANIYVFSIALSKVFGKIKHRGDPE